MLPVIFRLLTPYKFFMDIQGLITDLSETSDDLGHQTKISKDAPCYPPPAQTTLRLIAHIPCTILKAHQITAYRTTIMHLAKQALDQLPVSGIFIVGAQDIRTESGKLYPLGMLIMEDVIRAVGEDCLKLKELSKSIFLKICWRSFFFFV